MARNKLVEIYQLDKIKRWNIIDRQDDLCLLDGFYQGTVLSLERNVRQEWQKIKVIRVENANDVPNWGIFYIYPDGILLHIWTDQKGQNYTTKDKINDISIKQLIEDNGLNLIDGYYVVCSPETMSLTYKGNEYGIYRMDNLPNVDMSQANTWLGFGSKNSNGEMIYVYNPNDGESRMLKPPSKILRELIVLGDSYPDWHLLGMRQQKDLLTRWLDISSSMYMTDENYISHWKNLSGDISTPFAKLQNTYKCFLSSISRDITIYEDWYGVDTFKDYSNNLFSLTLENASSGLERLIVDVWPLVDGVEKTNRLLKSIRKRINNGLHSSTWDEYINLFLPGENGLTGFDINELRKLILMN